MIKIESAKQVAKLLGEKFGKTERIVLNGRQTDSQERHTFSTEGGILKGSYMSEHQTMALRDEVKQGEESIRATEEFNKEMGIVD